MPYRDGSAVKSTDYSAEDLCLAPTTHMAAHKHLELLYQESRCLRNSMGTVCL